MADVEEMEGEQQEEEQGDEESDKEEEEAPAGRSAVPPLACLQGCPV